MKIPNLPKTVFVTGASGFVGRNVLRELVKRGHKVRGLATSDADALVITELGASALPGDMLDSAFLTKAMQGCDWLLHLDREGTRDDRFLKNTGAVLSAAKAAGVKRAIYLSDAAVLFTGAALVNVNETQAIPSRFANAYCQRMAMAEMIALGEDAPGFDVIALRPHFIWGRDDTDTLPGLVTDMQSGDFTWIDGGGQPSATTHIANLVHGVFRALEKGQPANAYFITDGDAVNYRDFVTQLVAIQKVKAPTRSVSYLRAKIAARLGGAKGKSTTRYRYANFGVEFSLNSGKAQVAIGYWPVMPIADGMAELRSTEY